MKRAAQINMIRKSPLDRLAYAIATGAGAGLMPVAPGTFGAIEGLALFLVILSRTAGSQTLTPASTLLLFGAINVVVFATGVWASGRACAMCETKDPSQVVVDEVSGQLIALTPVALAPSAAAVLAAFVLFRLFDIYKPYPIRRLEHFRAGLGVMSDDALAGVYAAALVGLGIYLRLI
jgi:phosphatidylglycerophosphatase A